VKEYYYYLDATPTSSYLKFLYKYPHAAFPYSQLVDENKRRTRLDPEYELIDTGVFNESRYFDVFVEYAKACEDIAIRITAWNRGPEPASLHLLPTLWFRNRWDWGDPYDMPQAFRIEGPAGTAMLEGPIFTMGSAGCCSKVRPSCFSPRTNEHRAPLPDAEPHTLREGCVSSLRCERRARCGESGAQRDQGGRALCGASGSRAELDAALRFTDQNPADNKQASAKTFFGTDFEDVFAKRLQEADEFYAERAGEGVTEDARLVQRQAFAGLLWGKQSYHYDVQRWLDGDSTQPKPDPKRRSGEITTGTACTTPT
jgi:hypothetical protein